ncbi:hypothetical protein A33M_2284 [Rhodovulum sp. PH10]|nr:hypothetical protein A33M_2284 [Rhodovulum sp. PH10]
MTGLQIYILAAPVVVLIVAALAAWWWVKYSRDEHGRAP